MPQKKKRKAKVKLPSKRKVAAKPKVRNKRKIKPSDCSTDFKRGPLTDRIEETFCQNFIICPSAQAAYHRANPRVTWDSASVQSSRLLSRVRVRDRIMTLQARAADSTVLSQRRGLQILTEHAEADIANYEDLIEGKESLKEARKKHGTRALRKYKPVFGPKSERKNEIELHDSEKAIKNISDQSGWEPPKEVDLNVKGTLTIDDLIKDADGATRGLPPPRNKKEKR